ncbi:hypothetical protein [Trabulsiella guamensis]|nr:hypothetical protein [Trabulsiella guamensis]
MLRRALALLRKKLQRLHENTDTDTPSWFIARFNHTMTLSDLRWSYGCKVSLDVELQDGTHYTVGL